MDWAIKILRYICYTLDSVVYWLGSIMYRIFYLVSEVQIFDTDSAMGEIVSRIYVILGLVMFFVLAYNIILLIINPDNTGNNGDNSITKLVQNTVISILLIVLLPTIFNYMFQIQKGIIHNNVIGNIILGGSVTNDSDRTTAGTKVMATIFATFYHPIAGETKEALTPQDCVTFYDEYAICEKYLDALSAAYNSNRIGLFIRDDDLHAEVKKGENMEYIPVISTIAGGIAAYLFLSFALDVGVRAVKLGFLQIIAPIPVILRITKPHGGMFDKWFKEVKDTYLSVFLRLAVIFFTIFTINLVTTNVDLWPIEKSTTSGGTTVNENGHSHSSGKFSASNAGIEVLGSSLNKQYYVQTLDDINSLNDLNSENKVELLAVDGSAPGTEYGILRMAANLIIILGLLQFAKDAPKLIESLFGANGTLKWRIKDKLNDNEYFKRAATGTSALVGNTVKGFADIMSGRDPYGNLHGKDWSGRMAALRSHLYNAPASVFHSVRRGIVNGGNVDFSHGVRQGLRDVREQAGNAISETQTILDNSRRIRDKFSITAHDKDGNAIHIPLPGISRIVGAGSRRVEMIKQANAGTGKWYERLSARMNNDIGSSGNEAISNTTTAINQLFSINNRKVSEIKANFEGEAEAFTKMYNEQLIENSKSESKNKRDRDQLIGENTERKSYYDAIEQQRKTALNYKTAMDEIVAARNENRITMEEATRRIDALNQSQLGKSFQSYNELRNKIGTDVADQLESIYDKDVTLANEEIRIKAEKAAKRKQISNESKLAQMEQTGKNVMENEVYRLEFARDFFTRARQTTEGMSDEVLRKQLETSFKPKDANGEPLHDIDIDIRTLADVATAFQTGKYKTVDGKEHSIDSDGGKFMYAVDSLRTNLERVKSYGSISQASKKEDKK